MGIVSGGMGGLEGHCRSIGYTAWANWLLAEVIPRPCRHVMTNTCGMVFGRCRDRCRSGHSDTVPTRTAVQTSYLRYVDDSCRSGDHVGNIYSPLTAFTSISGLFTWRGFDTSAHRHSPACIKQTEMRLVPAHMAIGTLLTQNRSTKGRR
jgi:hypothetical protein